jgi:hypothetical protein
MIMRDHNTTLVEIVLEAEDENEVMQVGAGKENETYSEVSE